MVNKNVHNHDIQYFERLIGLRSTDFSIIHIQHTSTHIKCDHRSVPVFFFYTIVSRPTCLSGM